MAAHERPWWQRDVIYQIYPRSFQDSNGDGIGDLQGIISRLDYLQDLGVGGIWLSPIYPSPKHDFGYDISDYTGISPEFGTRADFEMLLAEAQRRGIKIIMDLVLNHTSHEHPWFQESATSRVNPRHDWYIWHDGKTDDRTRPPNNWLSIFGGRAWEWEPRRQQFYLHSFLKEQPDVNWRNPRVREAMWSVIRYWLDMGVDGFRLDVVNWFIKDNELRENARKLLGLRPYDRQVHVYDRNRPETLEIMKQIRAVVDEYPGRMTVGEVYAEPPGDPELSAAYYVGGEGLHMAFNFAFLYCPWQAKAFARVVDRWEALLGQDLWPNYTMSNHDQPRSFDRYGRCGDTTPRARVAAALLLTMRGTPFLYYGEEIGMRNGRIPRRLLQDPVGKRYWPFNKGRDGERTPMQWDASAHAGFGSTEPWLPVNRDYLQVNVEAQRDAPGSLFQWYRSLIALRQREPALHSGYYRRLKGPEDAFCYVREWGEDRVVVALSFSARRQMIGLPEGDAWRVLLGTGWSEGEQLGAGPLTLAAYDVLIAKAGPVEESCQ